LTFIAATTERGKVIKPLYDRFPIKPKFEEYSDDEMGAIAWGMLKKAELVSKYDSEFAAHLGAAAGGVPRNVRSMVIAIRDLIDSGTDAQPSIETVLDIANVTFDGLTDLHVDYLIVMGKNSGEGLGVKSLATQLQASEAMILDAENLLFTRDLITYTKSGRVLTPEGWQRSQELLR
jgi:Holliday junction resolvasome RuvABC ATP-dependent DNA helicase subunit